MAQFYSRFDNLAAAATNSCTALDQLAATTTTHYSEIKALLTAFNTASYRSYGPSSYDLPPRFLPLMPNVASAS